VKLANWRNGVYGILTLIILERRTEHADGGEGKREGMGTGRGQTDSVVFYTTMA